MKNLYTLVLSAVTAVTFAQQQTISFEASEGYQLGTIHNQNGWEVTEGSDGFLQNQVISNAQAKTGTMSFKNAYEPAFEEQWLPIFGASNNFAQPYPFNNFTISYDILVTETMGADFEFVLYAVNANNEFTPVAGVGLDFTGDIYFIKDADYDIEYIDTQWTPNTWVNVRVEVTTTQVKYYINNIPEYTLANFSALNIAGFNMLHNNYGGDAYYDNFIITTGAMGTDSLSKGAVAVYPNPAQDVISVQLGDNTFVGAVEILNVNGQKVLEAKSANVNVSTLAPGMYFAKISTSDGITATKKFIKK